MAKRKLTPKQRVLRKYPKAKAIRKGGFTNAPNDPFAYVSTKHTPHGGKLIGKGTSAGLAWADAARRLKGGR